MDIDGISASYTFNVPSDGKPGNWTFTCILQDEMGKAKVTEFQLIPGQPESQVLTGTTSDHCPQVFLSPIQKKEGDKKERNRNKHWQSAHMVSELELIDNLLKLFESSCPRSG